MVIQMTLKCSYNLQIKYAKERLNYELRQGLQFPVLCLYILYPNGYSKSADQARYIDHPVVCKLNSLQLGCCSGGGWGGVR